MLSGPQVTRFAPSPTGALHLGNARTALLNDLLARASGGRMVLRVEDTDAGRSEEGLLERLLEDLHWFGLAWTEGPDVGGPRGPYRQSLRAAHYDRAVAALEAEGLVYCCFCSPQALDLARRAQLAGGRPPRYAGTCASLPVAEVERRIAAGEQPARRFRVPAGRVIEFDDLIHGVQRFASDDIGDFVVRRADGSVAFFLGNALDDAAMEVTVVLRGDDHLANTPRQILLLEALGLTLPRYGHLPLLLGPGGTPLSKRAGAASLRDLRLQGYLPGALRNYLVRLGHACAREDWLEPDAMAADLDLGRASRSAPHFDEAQLRHWQREAVSRASEAELAAWLVGRLDRLGGRQRQLEFIAAVRGNLLFPADADPLIDVVCETAVAPDEEAARRIAAAGPGFFDQAAAAWQASATDFRAWTRAVGAGTGLRGADLFMPLRAALTGRVHGPELAPLVALMGPERVAARLGAASAIAAAA
jgi:glutamyl-tRNA synthetase